MLRQAQHAQPQHYCTCAAHRHAAQLAAHSLRCRRRSKRVLLGWGEASRRDGSVWAAAAGCGADVIKGLQQQRQQLDGRTSG